MNRYRWNIFGLCEMRWKNFGETTTEEGRKLFFSRKEDKHQHGVGFLVHKDFVNIVMGCRPVSSRLITIRLRAVPFNITIEQAYIQHQTMMIWEIQGSEHQCSLTFIIQLHSETNLKPKSCYRKIQCILYKDHVTNEEVRAKIQQAIEPYEEWPPDHRKETQSAVVWSCLPFIRSGQNHLARHSERGMKTRQTEEEVGSQHQGTDRPGVRQVPEGSGERENRGTGCEIICGVPTTLTVKG